MTSVVFKDKTVLARQLINELNSPTLVRLNKTLYLMYHFYIECFHDKLGFPERLFNANFEAWTYGPVERDLYEDPNFKNDKINETKRSEIHLKDPVPDHLDDKTLSEIFELLAEVYSATKDLSEWYLLDTTRQYGAFQSGGKLQ